MIWKTVHISPDALQSADTLSLFSADPEDCGKRRRPAAFAVVGGGPKGYYAVERLVYTLETKGRLADATIHWFNADSWFGCGGNFRPDQPEFLLVNNSIGTIDAAAIPADRNPLVHWINRHRLGELPSAVYTDFASRTLVGHYLTDTVGRFLNRLPEGADLRLVVGRVTDIIRSDGHLRMRVAEGQSERELSIAYQSVMLATGHSYSQRHPDWSAFANDNPGVVYIPHVYPVAVLNRVPAGSAVAIQGLGLTFVDAVLGLTEGRGGIFREEEDGLKYRPSGREPSVIFPFSRSNLPMLARSPVDPADRYPLRFVTARWANELRNRSKGSIDFEIDIIPILEREMAHAYHRTMWGDFDSNDVVLDRRIAEKDQEERFLVERFLFSAFPLCELAEESSQQRMQRYLKMGIEEAGKGERESPLMAAAAVWREAVPIIRELYANGGLSGVSHRIFIQRYYGALNRVAFGPPAANMRKVLSLAEAGYIRFPFASTPQVRTDRRKRMFIVSDGKEQVEVPVLIDARIARPDLDAGNSDLFANLLARGLAKPMENGGFRPGCVAISTTGSLLGTDGEPTEIAAYGTPTEGATLDNDSLSPSCSDLATPWAESAASLLNAEHFLPLTPIVHPWVTDITADVNLLHQTVATYGSPVNVHCLQPFEENLEAFGRMFREKGLDYRIYFARKANKCLSFAVRSHALSQGIDTASYRELWQCLDAGMPPDALVCTAAVKTPQLLELAISRGVEVVVDNEDECKLMQEIAMKLDKRVPVNVRVGGFIFQGKPLHTRFGWDINQVARFITTSMGKGNRFDRLDYSGLHFHLNGYSIAQRGEAILQCLALADRLHLAGFNTATLDIGGGILVNYLQSPGEWEAFNRALKDAVEGKTAPLTYLNHPLGMTVLHGKAIGEPAVYPYFSPISKEHFLRRVLEHRGSGGLTVAEEVRKRGISMRMEPGRSALDQCGITVARVAFRKRDSQGNLLVGLEMNGTQLRSSSADFLLDPIHIPSATVTNSVSPVDGFLVGAYCLEQELILKRRIRFKAYPQVGDLVVFVNTAGYMTHFYESEAHQFELASNVFFDVGTRRITEDVELATFCGRNTAPHILCTATQLGFHR